MTTIQSALCACTLLLTGVPLYAADYGSAGTFATVPEPGQPEGIAVDPRDGSVWTGSNRPEAGVVVWHYAADGTLLRTYPIFGHAGDAAHGINGITLDGDGYVYLLDYSGARAIRLDPVTGNERLYSSFPDLPACTPRLQRKATPCEPGRMDRQAWPNWGTFDAAGNLYVSDLNQATIWKVPPGGGKPQLWYQNADFASIYSLNGMQFDAQGRLVFVLTVSLQPRKDFAQGTIYRIDVKPDGSAGTLARVGRIGIGDGLAIGASGRLYAPLSQPGANRIEVLDGDTGEVLDELPSSATQQTLAIPFDDPASVAFSGTQLLVTNHSMYSQNPDHFAVLWLEVGEPGLPLHYPSLAVRTAP